MRIHMSTTGWLPVRAIDMRDVGVFVFPAPLIFVEGHGIPLAKVALCKRQSVLS